MGGSRAMQSQATREEREDEESKRDHSVIRKWFIRVILKLAELQISAKLGVNRE